MTFKTSNPTNHSTDLIHEQEAAEYRREDPPYVQEILENLPELPEYCGNSFHKALRHARAADEGGA